jgi:hypothetical protein
MSEQGVQEGIEHVPLMGPCVEDQREGCVVTYPYHLGVARQEVQDPVTDEGVKPLGPWLSDELRGQYGVKR